MNNSTQPSFPTQSLPQHCTPTIPFLLAVSGLFHICVPTPLAALSTALGALSIVSWLFAQLPQIYKNHQLQSTAGLSVFFLVEWCLGDTTNLIGALFTHQAGWQVLVASYYVFVDVCLVYQYFWYTYLKPRLRHTGLRSPDGNGGGDADSDSISRLSPINPSFAPDDANDVKEVDADDNTQSAPRDVPRFAEVKYEKAMLAPSDPTPNRVAESASSSSWNPDPSPRPLLYTAAVCALVAHADAAPTLIHSSNLDLMHFLKADGGTETAGAILSWCSTLLYLGSRLPQLYKNWNRQSTAGLSPLLFLAAFCGNLFYSTSLLTNPNGWYNFGPYGGHGWVGEEGSERWSWVARAAPFFLGAAGVLALDGAMGVQFLLYGDNQEEKIVKVRDDSGISRWERVDGWMRGWVPSMGAKERLVDIEEGERLLSESRELARRRYSTF